MTLILPKKKIIKKADNTEEQSIHFVTHVIKGETYLVMAQSSALLEDEYSTLYYSASAQSNLFLMPPFEPNVLLNLVSANNILNQCVEAMEVNIDGTGHEFVSIEKDKDVDQEELKIAEAFFNEPFTNEHFISMRRKLRRYMEGIGYGFIEVLRSIEGKVVGLRNIETQHVRMVKLDEPIQVTKPIMRNGKEVELTYWERERRFAQTVALKQHIYYREFGSTREIHRDLGTWESKDNPIPPDMRGTELLMFGINPDVMSPYFVPRWINQLPSVIGSRNAEEQNLQFLDAGGMPPAIIFVQGGTMVKGTSDQLKMYLSGQNKNKHRAVVVEVQSNSGSIDSNTGKVDVKVERFGAEKAQDAMFMKYDMQTEEHVRTGFRLPPLFLGKAVDYNFATAKTSYMVAEAQVFAPERTDFDEVINKTIMKELGLKTLKFKSKPITLTDIDSQLKGMELGKDTVTRETFVKELNTATGMALEMSEVPAQNVADGEQPLKHTQSLDETPSGKLPANVTPKDMTAPQPKPEPDPTEQEQAGLATEKSKLEIEERKQKLKLLRGGKKTAIELIDLAQDYADIKGLTKKRDVPEDMAKSVLAHIVKLDSDDKEAFDTLLAQIVYGNVDPDLVDLASDALAHIG